MEDISAHWQVLTLSPTPYYMTVEQWPASLLTEELYSVSLPEGVDQEAELHRLRL